MKKVIKHFWWTGTLVIVVLKLFVLKGISWLWILFPSATVISIYMLGFIYLLFGYAYVRSRRKNT